MLILAIDPGCAAKPTPRTPRPDPARHGWCLLEILPDQRPVWCNAGHDERGLLVDLIKMSSDLGTVVVERPSRAHKAEANMPLLETAFAAGEFAGLASAAGRAVHVLTAEVWRLTVTGLRGPTDAQVKAALGRLLTLPARSNAHERDACGVGLGWALRSGVLVGGKGRRLPAVAP